MTTNFNYLFYDLETSGLNKSFNQVQQFAGKILDLKMNEKESHFLEARLSPDTIVSPYAIITHRISLKDDQKKSAELHTIKKIHQMFNTQNTISLGYNTLGFDDEFLRFSFYRNLLTPYTHQYANGCRRMDIFPMAVFYYLFSTDSIKWPQVNNQVSLKLEALAKENNWECGRAHHAMNDVDVTIALAKKMQQSNEKMWMYLTGYFDKVTDSKRIGALELAFNDSPGSHLGLMINAKFGAKNNFQAPVIALGRHNHYKNQTTWLRLDSEEIKKATDYAELESKGLIIRKKLSEPGFLLPWNESYGKHLSKDRADIAQNNIQHLNMQKELFKDISHQACQFTYPSIENVDVDSGLYELGFRTRQEEDLCNKFHVSPEKSRIELLESCTNPLLKKQMLRCIWRLEPKSVPYNNIEDIMQYQQALAPKKGPSTIIDYKGNPRPTPKEVLTEINSIDKDSLDTEQKALLVSLEAYVKIRFLNEDFI